MCLLIHICLFAISDKIIRSDIFVLWHQSQDIKSDLLVLLCKDFGNFRKPPVAWAAERSKAAI